MNGQYKSIAFNSKKYLKTNFVKNNQSNQSNDSGSPFNDKIIDKVVILAYFYIEGR